MKKFSKRTLKKYRRNILKTAMQRILDVWPDAIGCAILEYDCHCQFVVGVSAKGDKVGDSFMLPSHPACEDGIIICQKCAADLAKNSRINPERVIREAIAYPGGPEEEPAKEVRNLIRKKVFGVSEAQESDLAVI